MEWDVPWILVLLVPGDIFRPAPTGAETEKKCVKDAWTGTVSACIMQG